MKTKPVTKVEVYFNVALMGVESESIRLWAETKHNRPIMLKVADQLLAKNEPVEKMTIFIVSNAIGLW